MSSINSDKIKQLIHDAVDNALNELAEQHDCWPDMFPNNPQWFNLDPVKLKLTFNVYWNEDEKDRSIPDMFCQPTIKLR